MAKSIPTKSDNEENIPMVNFILGYQPFRMKPVHFATNFFQVLTGRCYKLEYLNKTSVLKTAPMNENDEYPSDRLHPRLIALGLLHESIKLKEFRVLRAHLNAAFNNDGSALYPGFPPYKSPFSTDYSAPSDRYISNKSKNHGHSGSFVVSVFESTTEGKKMLAKCREILELNPPPSSVFGEPLLDADYQKWHDRREKLCGSMDSDKIQLISLMMKDCTNAMNCLVTNLLLLRSDYSLRYMIMGLCCWLFAYIMRQGRDSPLLLIDALQGRNPRIRSQSRASYAKALSLFSSCYDRWLAGYSNDQEADRKMHAKSEKANQQSILEDHFRDLGVRIGIVQPRSANAKYKHIEVQADTLRVLALSLLEPNEIIPLTEFATRLYKGWSILVGAHAMDSDILRSNNFRPLDQDEDLRPNAEAFKDLLVRLGLAVEPSDGLTLVAIDPEEMI